MSDRQTTTQKIIQYVLNELPAGERLKIQNEVQASPELRAVYERYRVLIGTLKGDAEATATLDHIYDENQFIVALQQRIETQESRRHYSHVLFLAREHVFVVFILFFTAISLMGVWRFKQSHVVSAPIPYAQRMSLKRPSLLAIQQPSMAQDSVFQLAQHHRVPEFHFSIPSWLSVSDVRITKPSLVDIKNP
ncbi:MAG: hypothetical protein K8S27_11635 [Candidatus Omnitrophica bacterium]|nr:hypothetical protein [Candidatus Omnitrophota bacterium]